ncbi:MAG: Tim44 domain-containing protein [Pseudomonadota bacterium]
MRFSQRTRALVKMLAVALTLAMPLAVAMSEADARPGGRGSMGSRGSKTYSAPPATQTAPGAAQPMQRTQTQPGATTPAAAPQPQGGFFNRPGMGMLGGLAAGFLGAGLLGMLFGGGFMSGLGSFASILGLIIQVVLVVVIARFALNWWRRRQSGADNTAFASGPSSFDAPRQQQGTANPYAMPLGGGAGGGGFNNRPVPLQIKPDDYDAFERMLGEVQMAWSNEDEARLNDLATPEMASYFREDLAANRNRGVVNKVSNVKLLQGDLAEAWSEGPTDYATLAMRFALTDKTIDRASGRVIDGSDTPTEATEVWTFSRRHGGNWELSAIQQTN